MALTRDGWDFYDLAKKWGAVFTDDKHFAEEAGELFIKKALNSKICLTWKKGYTCPYHTHPQCINKPCFMGTREKSKKKNPFCNDGYVSGNNHYGMECPECKEKGCNH